MILGVISPLRPLAFSAPRLSGGPAVLAIKGVLFSTVEERARTAVSAMHLAAICRTDRAGSSVSSPDELARANPEHGPQGAVSYVP